MYRCQTAIVKHGEYAGWQYRYAKREDPATGATECTASTRIGCKVTWHKSLREAYEAALKSGSIFWKLRQVPPSDPELHKIQRKLQQEAQASHKKEVRELALQMNRLLHSRRAMAKQHAKAQAKQQRSATT